MGAFMRRPPVTVIVPFAGNRTEAVRVVAGLLALETIRGDELFLVDNSSSPVATPEGGVRVLRADRVASSYYARNIGATQARNEWLLFTDSDCLLPTTLLSDFFRSSPGERCGMVAGEVEAAVDQTSLVARYEASRGHLGVEQHLEMGPTPAGITANLLVRKRTWEELQGFREVRSGADVEFCYRAGAAGWTLRYAPEARVQHLHTESLGAMLRKARRYGPGQAWVNGRYPGAAPRPHLLRQSVRAVGGSLVWALRREPTKAAYKILDGLWSGAYALGYRFGGNDARALRP
jgi:GT2 family glycosyltransferase